MKQCLFIFLFALSFQYIGAQRYSRVHLDISNTEDLSRLKEMPLALDHAHWKLEVDEVVIEVNDFELDLIQQANIPFHVEIDDLELFYSNRLSEQQHLLSTKNVNCDSTVAPLDPINFELGSMGGYYTYQEMLDDLDSMHSLFPNLISAKEPIHTFTTEEGRPLYWVRISNTPNTDDPSKPEILYTSNHHAREAAALSINMYTMWHILENYASDEDLRYLVDNVEMYFVPLVNPDGWVYNETIQPNGGGMWRKNRRNNGNGTFGVDLNRNYGYEWGGVGSSGNGNSDVYRGTTPFSEAESQALKWFTEQHAFQIALNYHTAANMLLHPWGYTDNIECDDHDRFIAFKSWMTEVNGYLNIQSSLLYEAAGDSDDWMYGDTTTKPKILAMTPECGSNADGFWPPTSRILPLCRENLPQNLRGAYILLDYLRVEDLSSDALSVQGVIDISMQRLGLPESSGFIVDLESLDPAVTINTSAKLVSGLSYGESILDSFDYTVDTQSLFNPEVGFVLSVNNGSHVFRDTLYKRVSVVNPALSIDGTTLSPFQNEGSSSWSTTTEDFVSAPTSITDSPNDDYENQTTQTLLLTPIINLSNAQDALVRFAAKWDIEADYDYVQFEALRVSSTGLPNDWLPLCGKYTNSGTPDQDEGMPLYDGVQNTWVEEEVDMTEFIGDSIQLRFQLVSDNFVTGDGFYFDDFKLFISGNMDSVINNLSAMNNPAPLAVIVPNPARNNIRIETAHPWNGHISILNALGQEVMRHALHTESQQGILNIGHLPAGSYYIHLRNPNQPTTVLPLWIQ